MMPLAALGSLFGEVIESPKEMIYALASMTRDSSLAIPLDIFPQELFAFFSLLAQAKKIDI